MLIVHTPWMHTAIHTLRLLVPVRSDVRITVENRTFQFEVFVVCR